MNDQQRISPNNTTARKKKKVIPEKFHSDDVTCDCFFFCGAATNNKHCRSINVIRMAGKEWPFSRLIFLL